MSRLATASTRRRFLFLIGGSAAAAIVAACGGSAPPASTPAPAGAQSAGAKPPADKPAEKPAPPATAAAPARAGGATTRIRATVWIGQAELDALGKMTNAYKEKSPGVDVEWINISGGGPYGRDKLQAMIAGGDAPDQMMLNTGQFEGLAGRGALLPLDDMVKADNADLGIHWPQAVDGSKFGGKLFALPRDMSNVILYYNKDLFDKAGLKYPTDDWGWNDLLEAAKKTTLDKGNSGKINQWGFGIFNFVWAWAGFVWGNGGEILSADRKKSSFQDPKTVEALKFYFGLLSEHKVSPPPGALPEQATPNDQFRLQSVAMGVFGPWYRPTLVNLPADRKFNWDVAYPPKAPGSGKRGSVVYTDHWSVGSGSKVARETWSFMRFLTGKEGQTMWTDLIGARSISPVKEVAQTEKWIKYGGSSGQIILDSLSFSQAPPVNFANANEAEPIWNDELGLVIAGQARVEQAVASIDAKLTPVLAANK